jgi:hypothetical protein
MRSQKTNTALKRQHEPQRLVGDLLSGRNGASRPNAVQT